MHISEGVLSAPVLVTGVALTAAGCGISLKKLDYERVLQVAILTSAFFVASLIHVSIGPSNIYLALNGLMGLLLGSLMVAISLVFTGNSFTGIAKVVVIAHLTMMIIEDLIALFSAGRDS